LKLLFISDNFPPEVNAPATRTFEHCKIWVEEGAEVTVVTCAPNFPAGKVFKGYRNRLRQTEWMSGIKVVRVWSYITPNVGFAKRIADYLSFALSAFIAGLTEKPDVIIATSPQFFTTLAGYGLSLAKRRPWIFELRDLWPESIAAVGAMKRGRLVRWLEKLELFLYRKADRIIAVTPAFRANLIERGVAANKIGVVTNGVDKTLFEPSPKDGLLCEQLALNDKFVVGYIGTHGMAHGLEFILRSLSKLNTQDIHFLFIGDGAEKKKLLEIREQFAITNVSFVDSVTKNEVARYLSVLDVALVPLRRSETFKTVIPSKIFEAAAMRKPILLGVDGQAREIIESYGAGLYFEPENQEAFLRQLKRLATDKGLYQELQSGCDDLAAAYDRKALALDMLATISQLRTQ